MSENPESTPALQPFSEPPAMPVQPAPPIPPPVQPLDETTTPFVAPEEFRSPVGHARRTIIACIVNMVLNGAIVTVGLLQILLVRSSVAGNGAAEGILTVTDTVATVLWIAVAGFSILLLIFLLMWVYRCYSNLKSLQAEGLSMSPGWAVGYFFVPILNLIRPYEAVSEIWKASDPLGVVSPFGNNDVLSWKKLSAPPMIGWWWFFWIASQAVTRLTDVLTRNQNPTPEEWQTQTLISMTSQLFDFIPLILTILIVRRATDRQMRKASLVAEATKPAPFDVGAAIPATLTEGTE